MFQQTQQLLRRFQTERCEESFTRLVELYSTLVYATAFRCVGRDPEAAKDITQAVFIDFSRKVNGFDHETVVGGWLHRHTFFLASKFVRAEQRRKKRETNVEHLPIHSGMTQDFQERVFQTLDELIEKLSAQDRSAILLRFYQEMSYSEASQCLGISEDAMRMRLKRALKRLAIMFNERGIPTSNATLVGALAAVLAQPIPSTLATSIASRATPMAAVSVGTFINQITNIMSSFHLKSGVAAALIATAVTIPLTSKYVKNHLNPTIKDLESQISVLEASHKDFTEKLEAARNVRSLPTEEFRELLRLRGEVGLLREMVKSTEVDDQMNLVADEPAAPDSKQEEQEFLGVYNVTLPRDSVMGIGGWEVGSGRRFLMFLETNVDEIEVGESQVHMEVKMYDIPDNQLDNLGLQELRSDGLESKQSIVFPKDHFNQLVESMKNEVGIVRTATPGITTLLGRQASIRQVGGSGNAVEINILAESANEDSLNLNVVAQIPKLSDME